MPEQSVALGQNEAQRNEDSNDSKLYVCFKLANEQYALDIQSIQEVIKEFRITPVPQMPEFCLGILNNRGNVIPVFDLRKKFHLQCKEFDPSTRILVAIIEGITISVVVDEVLDNIRFTPRQIDPAPTVKMKIERDCVFGLGETQGRMIIILALEKVHEFIKKDISEFQKTGTDERNDK